MTAIITDILKKELIENLYDDVLDSTQNYFIGIGRSEDWDSLDLPPTPINSLEEISNFRTSLQSIKKTNDVTFTVPRINWSSGSIYSAYNDVSVGYPTPSYYVMNENNQIYICIQQGKNSSGVSVTSTIQPTSTSTQAFKTSDGYIWKFLYSLSPTATNKFLSANFIPVNFVKSIDSNSSAIDIEQSSIQSAAIPGQIIGVDIVSNGGGYSSAPTISIFGNGSGAIANATVFNGQITKVEMLNESGGLGTNYDYANIELSGGSPTTPAKLRPILTPKLGLGKNVLNDLKVNSVMISAKPSGDEGGDFIVDNSFRQVGLMKNVLKPNDSDFTALTGSGLNVLRLSSLTNSFSINKTIEGSISGAKGHLDDVDSSILTYHQNSITGFKSFVDGENIIENNGSGSGVLDSNVTDADFNPFSGDVLYISNKAAIERSTSQTEDLKFLIQI